MGGVKAKVVLGVNAYDPYDVVELPIRNGGNILCVASPRYGKGALCKDVAVQVSKFKRVCVFDYRGEWIEQVTRENPDADFPDAFRDYFVAENFAFPITDFNRFGDWIGLGFDDSAAAFMQKIVSSKCHGGDILKVREMIRDLPKNDTEVVEYNEEYGTDLLVGIHSMSKDALGRRFEVVQRLFWTGEADARRLIDFGAVVGNFRHLLVDLSDRRDGFEDLGKARAYAGIIARKISPELGRWFFVVEEASQILAEPQVLADGSRVGVSEFHKIVLKWVTLNPKHGVLVLVICQSRSQIYGDLLKYLPLVLQGRLSSYDVLKGREGELNVKLSSSDVFGHVFWLVDDHFNTFKKFRPGLPRCLFETNK